MSWNASRADPWIYWGLAVLFAVAAGLRLVLGNSVAGAISLSVAASVLLFVIPWLALRWLMGELSRKSTEDKLLRDVRTYLSGPLPEAAHPARPEKAPRVALEFRDPGGPLRLQMPEPALVVLDAIPPRPRNYDTTLRFNWPLAA